MSFAIPLLQAINLYGERPYLQPGLPEARDFAQAAEHSKQLTAAFRADIQKHWDELEAARKKLQVRAPALNQLRARADTRAACDLDSPPVPHPISMSSSCLVLHRSPRGCMRCTAGMTTRILGDGRKCQPCCIRFHYGRL